MIANIMMSMMTSMITSMIKCMEVSMIQTALTKKMAIMININNKYDKAVFRRLRIIVWRLLMAS